MGGDERRRVLVTMTDSEAAQRAAAALADAGCDVRTADNGDRALAAADSFRPHLVVLDVAIPEQDGWLVCSKLKLLRPAPFIALATASLEQDQERFAEFVHADALLGQPLQPDQLVGLLDRIDP